MQKLYRRAEFEFRSSLLCFLSFKISSKIYFHFYLSRDWIADLTISLDWSFLDWSDLKKKKKLTKSQFWCTLCNLTLTASGTVCIRCKTFLEKAKCSYSQTVQVMVENKQIGYSEFWEDHRQNYKKRLNDYAHYCKWARGQIFVLK